MSEVLTTVDGDVGTIVLNRPEQMNAITVELGRELRDALVLLARGVNVIVIRGSAGNFCVGGDFRQLERLRAHGRDAMAPLFANFRAACDVIATLPVPVICAVEGYAMAGGFELIQAADIVLLHENAVLSDTHTRFGQIPGGGSTQRLPRLVGRQRALAHILTGDRLTATDALEWGLAYRVFETAEFDSGVKKFADRLAAKDAVALARVKQLVNASQDTTLADGLDLEFQAVLTHVVESGVGARS
ncbi:enoyl-CoA hydratase/isomerase family protein [Smaragdicoccus niigatensis]|uniref:enoyl-CoA hydratase/isomerase family protein n=1 Tax=Smaragdicoccus niigatensis TaxID=359359 RepID=UPI00036448C0|nr:enoyl-CoA hydratase/isomerase family protein [Smaragdicoccus niigatensis]